MASLQHRPAAAHRMFCLELHFAHGLLLHHEPPAHPASLRSPASPRAGIYVTTQSGRPARATFCRWVLNWSRNSGFYFRLSTEVADRRGQGTSRFLPRRAPLQANLVQEVRSCGESDAEDFNIGDCNYEDHRPGWFKYRMVLAYDGTKFSGWQWQPKKFTVQQAVEEAITRVTSRKRDELHMATAGRTDAGVHARGCAL